jgi:mevalonate kinase
MSPLKTIQNYKANAKLMISGEYLVLRGAEALAIPLRKTQNLKISEHAGTPSLTWKTYVNGQYWFDVIFSLDQFIIGNSNDFPTAQNLREILLAAKSLQPSFLHKKVKYEAISGLDFDINWGFGSSASLIANIANWAAVDPFELFRKVSSGSGYDLAAAMSDRPVLYKNNDAGPQIRPVDFYPVFHDNLYFAYLGKKRNSAQAVNSFNSLAEKDLSSEIHDIDAISRAMLVATELREFRRLMRNHEKIMAGVLGIPPLSYKILSDFDGDMKSLGAWGGDFIMLATDMPREYVVSWLRKKEMNVWFAYEDIALKL